MGEIHVHEFMSFDGVIDAPTWTFEYGFDPKMGEVLGAITERSKGILLGRTTYEAFAQAWPDRTAEDDPGAPFFNDTTKYVVSGTLTEPVWQSTELIGAYDAARIQRLVDLLHLFIYPLTLGAGTRLFTDADPSRKLSLAACESYDNGVVYTGYRPQA